jgi:RNA polymerase sigma factor (TIGR02999 family)
MGELTALLDAARQGDRQALDRLFSLMYADLHRLAHLRLTRSERPTQLDTTALLHESYLRFVGLGQLDVADKGHFLGYAAKVMRSIIIDFARKRLAERRGGSAAEIPLDTDLAEALPSPENELIRIDEALKDLAKRSERLVRVVEMRYFAGLSEPEIAEVLGVTERTVRRDWEKARLLLFAALK